MWIFLNSIILLIVNRIPAELDFAIKFMNFLLDSFNLLLTSFVHFNSFLAWLYSLLSQFYLVHSYIAIEININTPFQTLEKIFLKSFSLLRTSSLLNSETYQLPLKSLILGVNGLGRGLEEIWTLETDTKTAVKVSELAVKPVD